MNIGNQLYMSYSRIMGDKMEFAMSGISKGKTVIACKYDTGIIIVTENQWSTMYKIGEIYDNIAFAGVGKYNEFDLLRVYGTRIADIHGYIYDRTDVRIMSLVSWYSKNLGFAFASQNEKPFEIEILLASVDKRDSNTPIYSVRFDGSIYQYRTYAVIGGDKTKYEDYLKSHYRENMSFNEIKQFMKDMMHQGVQDSNLQLESAILDRTTDNIRKFKRISLDS